MHWDKNDILNKINRLETERLKGQSSWKPHPYSIYSVNTITEIIFSQNNWYKTEYYDLTGKLCINKRLNCFWTTDFKSIKESIKIKTGRPIEHKYSLKSEK